MKLPTLNELLNAKEGENVEFKKGKIHSHGKTRAGRWYPGPLGEDCNKHNQQKQ